MKEQNYRHMRMWMIGVVIGAVAVFGIASMIADPVTSVGSLATPTPTPARPVETKVLKKGKGATVKSGDKIRVHYKGMLTDGTVFDTSIGSDPYSFTLGTGAVIKGWDQGIVGMKVGEKRQLTIPPELAYGESGSGSQIPPNATLVFEVELLKIEK